MMNQLHDGKKVIWESKPKRILLIVVCLILGFLGLWDYFTEPRFGFFIFASFSGTGGLYLLIQFINPKNIFVTHESQLGKLIIAEQLRNAENDLGFFCFDGSGFEMKVHKGSNNYSWSEIKAIVAYKEDRFTTDEICLDICFEDDSHIWIDESTLGWDQFKIKLAENLSLIESNWEEMVMFPPFEKNPILIYKNDKPEV